MIFGNARNLSEYDYLEERIQACFTYAASHDLSTFEKGSHPIMGDDLFVNIVEYTTTTPENRFWEAHRQYLDLHFMLSGEEQIDLNFIENLSQSEYVPTDDFLPLEGEKNGQVILREGDFLLCFPHDAHRTAVAVNSPCTIRKAIFKIKI